MPNATFNTDQIKEAKQKIMGINREYQQMFFSWLPLKLNREAENFLRHGFLRRCGLLKRCIQKVHELCPMDSDRVEDDKLTDTEVYLQSFIINISGSLDDLAHILNFQLDLKLSKHEIGLIPNQKKFKPLHDVLGQNLKNKLSEYKQGGWFEYILSYRHDLAHQIPLYIPPRIIDPKHEQAYKALISNRFKCSRNLDFQGAKAIDDEIKKIAVFKPIIVHDFLKKHKKMFFHSQILIDWATIIELSSLVIKEIEDKKSEYADKTRQDQAE